MVYGIIIIFIFLAEYLIKTIVELFVPWGEKKMFLKGHLFLTKYHNRGAALNFMEKKRAWVAACSLILSIICTIVFILTLTKSGGEGLKLSLAFLLGGAYSNTYDRLRRKYVVDYIGFSRRRGNEIIYNLSDFCIILGALFATIFGVK
ncbi:MAG: signal peptidase II [Lachnospiraceae bacterium]|nr:signal peptidase II [Lachnospiraceae bacterium]